MEYIKNVFFKNFLENKFYQYVNLRVLRYAGVDCTLIKSNSK